MREYARISPQFWIGATGRQIRQLGLEAQHIALYVMTSPHSTMLGVYYLPIPFIVHETGISKEHTVAALHHLSSIEFCTYDEEAEYIWIHNMAFYQIGGDLKPTDNRIKEINQAYAALPEVIFLAEFYEKYRESFQLKVRRENRTSTDSRSISCEGTTKPLATPFEGISDHLQTPFEGTSNPLRSQEKEQEQDQEKEQEKESGAAPEKISDPIMIPLLNRTEFLITQTMLNEWQQSYPLLNVEQILRNIREWNIANPTRRKTRGGILRHITNWLTREQQQSSQSSLSRAPPAATTLFDYNKTIAEQWLSQPEQPEKSGDKHEPER